MVLRELLRVLGESILTLKTARKAPALPTRSSRAPHPRGCTAARLLSGA